MEVLRHQYPPSLLVRAMSGSAVPTAHEDLEIQRSYELRKFFAPENAQDAVDSAFNESLNKDGALDAYAETIVWRLRGVHAMVSLVDRGQQYFLAGAIRDKSRDDDLEVTSCYRWFGCTSVPTPGGLCENTLSLDIKKEDYPCFIVKDLSIDDRFRKLPVVDGTITSYRFYAGTPIVAENGISIGSFFLFDDKPREDLTLIERKFLHQQAANIMKHLSMKREAAERRRAAMMSKGISDFLEQTSEYTSPTDLGRLNNVASKFYIENDEEAQQVDDNPEFKMTQAEEIGMSVLDRIRATLDRASNILRESLEISSGGVIFLDTAVDHSESQSIGTSLNLRTQQRTSLPNSGSDEQLSNVDDPLLSPVSGSGRHLSQPSIRSSADKHKFPRVLAQSVSPNTAWKQDASIFNSGTLDRLTKSYPKGNIWSVDGEGFYTSLDYVNGWERANDSGLPERKRSFSPLDASKRRAEASVLSKVFDKARQIMFLPLWDSGAGRLFAGCFVWTDVYVPIFTMESELGYLSALTNSMLVEINRLEAITNSKLKSDFLGSISHEFRSPLHGILASAEFLGDSPLDSSQTELVSTIQYCSGTLLDTINHVLDYSKINSFETYEDQKGPISSELYQPTNLALLCEDVVEGMVAANGFRGVSVDDTSMRAWTDPLNRDAIPPKIEVILNIEPRDWLFKVQAGALRRIMMNLFGNAQKFTKSGYIMVELRISEKTSQDIADSPSHILTLNIRDSGKGMSSEFMDKRLYHPFSQEDEFTPGVGLGLSVVWGILNQIGGKIQIRSDERQGTDVEVTIAVEKADSPTPTEKISGDLMKTSAEAEHIIAAIHSRAKGKTLFISRNNWDSMRARYKEMTWVCVERYCREWFGFEVKLAQSGADLVISDNIEVQAEEAQRLLIIHEDMNIYSARGGNSNKNLCNPIGPFKLARYIQKLMDQEIVAGPAVAVVSSGKSDVGTQTPVGSPDERRDGQGAEMTEYGFPAITTANIDVAEQELRAEREAGAGSDSETQTGDQASTLFKVAPALALRLQSSEPNTEQQDPMQDAVPTDTTLESDKTALASSAIPTLVSPPKSPLIDTSAPPEPLKVLAVDDNEINLQLLHRCLKKRKIDTAVTAMNGIEAVDAVRQAGVDSRFDIIFMDISMPQMDGFEATRVIRSYEASCGLGYRTYIVALTGLGSRRDRDEAERCGLDDFLTKPISFKKIGELLDRLSLEKAKALTEI